VPACRACAQCGGAWVPTQAVSRPAADSLGPEVCRAAIAVPCPSHRAGLTRLAADAGGTGACIIRGRLQGASAVHPWDTACITLTAVVHPWGLV